MSATPAAQRKAAERDRKRKDGLIPVQEWIHQDDAARLKQYANKLRHARLTLEKK